MNEPVTLSPTALSVDHNLTLTLFNNPAAYPQEPTNNCSVALQYKFVEHIFYLYFMSPLCLIGLILNVINLIIFSDRSFKNLTFKYLRLVAFVDCITCTLVFIYCITNYTRPRTLNDKYFRIWYLVNVYFPLANITAGCNVLLTITVTIERLVSVRWPMSKQQLFTPNRVLLTLIICFLFPIIANSVNFLVYKVGECNNLDATIIATTEAYKYFGICKEILLRFIPICILICSNCLLLATVHAANRKFIPTKHNKPSISDTTSAVPLQPLSSNGFDNKPTNKGVSDSQLQADNRLPVFPEPTTTNGDERKASVPMVSKTKMQIRKQQQEKQLTIMLVWLSTLYLCGQIPMLFAYPNFVFKDTSKPSYKYYALVVNLLELITYLANFFIYIKFTTQFQLHIAEHEEHPERQTFHLDAECKKLMAELNQENLGTTFLCKVEEWETETIKKVHSAAQLARDEIQQFVKEFRTKISSSIDKLLEESQSSRQRDRNNEDDSSRWMRKIQALQAEIDNLSQTEISYIDFSPAYRIKIKHQCAKESNQTNTGNLNTDNFGDKSGAVVEQKISQVGEISRLPSPRIIKQTTPYPCYSFGLNANMYSLFEYLMKLDPMDKYGPMSGDCSKATDQMERFLQKAFGFRNIPGKYIVQGVTLFELNYPLEEYYENKVIHFPFPNNDSFQMSVEEIKNWQRSYRVYADACIPGMDKAFLKRALYGKSRYGEEAFRMKFVVRVSTCPILMEFDAKIISRKSDEKWPNNVKLVSVTGIDFAGRIHDISDIIYYISNWRDVYYVDSHTGLPRLYGERDLHVRPGIRAKIHEERVRRSLIRMARLRLYACDSEKVQIVVETGIGLGVFAGSSIGIDAQIRALSAKAIRKVLEEDGPSYKNIRAVIFALPKFNIKQSNESVTEVFEDFVNEFRRTEYNGCIPVLIADQDMHRLTVAIARHGLIVSELNPADSHGVFGEYWQNRGPAVEEKLALTTVGLLVQHHLINKEVLNENNYQLVNIDNEKMLDWEDVVINGL